MIRQIQRKWFEVWADEEAQNRILKYLLLLASMVTVVQLVVIVVLAFKRPLIVSVTDENTSAVQYQEPNPDRLLREVIRAIESYLRKRHNWDWTTIDAKSKEAILYIAPDFRQKFFVNTQEQIRVAKEKQVSQRLFPYEPQVDMKVKKATVKAERILIVNGIRAAQELRLEVGFALGERTERNPEGVYVTSENLNLSN